MPDSSKHELDVYDEELGLDELDHVAGGFNPQPEPPGAKVSHKVSPRSRRGIKFSLPRASWG